jgi:hypothetical protein
MTAAEKSRAFIAEHNLAAHVAAIVDVAPLLPERVAETWRDAARRSILKVGASDE